MWLAGIPARDELFLKLARLVDDLELAGRLEDCYRREIRVLGLSLEERESLLIALDDPPAGLEELRSSCFRTLSGGGERDSRSAGRRLAPRAAG